MRVRGALKTSTHAVFVGKTSKSKEYRKTPRTKNPPTTHQARALMVGPNPIPSSYMIRVFFVCLFVCCCFFFLVCLFVCLFVCFWTYRLKAIHATPQHELLQRVLSIASTALPLPQLTPTGQAATVTTHLRPASWRPTTVEWRQFSQSNRHSTIGTRQTEYHEALPSSANVQSHLTSSFADDGNASWYSVCRVPMAKWQLDCQNCRYSTVVGLHDTGPWMRESQLQCRRGPGQENSRYSHVMPRTDQVCQRTWVKRIITSSTSWWRITTAEGRHL